MEFQFKNQIKVPGRPHDPVQGCPAQELFSDEDIQAVYQPGDLPGIL